MTNILVLRASERFDDAREQETSTHPFRPARYDNPTQVPARVAKLVLTTECPPIFAN